MNDSGMMLATRLGLCLFFVVGIIVCITQPTDIDSVGAYNPMPFKAAGTLAAGTAFLLSLDIDWAHFCQVLIAVVLTLIAAAIIALLAHDAWLRGPPTTIWSQQVADFVVIWGFALITFLGWQRFFKSL